MDLNISKEKDLRKQLKHILDENYFMNDCVESCGLRSIIPILTKFSGFKIVLAGPEDLVYLAICFFANQNINKEKIIYINEEKHGQDFYGVECLSLNSFKQINDKTNGNFALIYMFKYTRKNLLLRLRRKIIHEILIIIKLLDRNKSTMIKILGKKYSKLNCKIIEQFDVAHMHPNFPLYYKAHNTELLNLYDILSDEESKEVLLEYVTAVMNGGGWNKRELFRDTTEKYIDKSIYNWLPKEYVVCCGAYIGDTFCNFIEADFPFEKMYMIEGNKSYISKGKQYLSFLPDIIRQKAEWYNIFLDDNNPLDVICKDKKVTLIEMDIEGAELLALAPCLKIINQQRPVIAVCAYHKPEDLVDIPQFFQGNLTNYKLYLRKYYSFNHAISKDELVLYAVPEERVCANKSLMESI